MEARSSARNRLCPGPPAGTRSAPSGREDRAKAKTRRASPPARKRLGAPVHGNPTEGAGTMAADRCRSCRSARDRRPAPLDVNTDPAARSPPCRRPEGRSSACRGIKGQPSLPIRLTAGSHHGIPPPRPCGSSRPSDAPATRPRRNCSGRKAPPRFGPTPIRSRSLAVDLPFGTGLPHRRTRRPWHARTIRSGR